MVEGKEFARGGIEGVGSREVASIECWREDERWIGGSVAVRLGEREGVRLKGRGSVRTAFDRIVVTPDHNSPSPTMFINHEIPFCTGVDRSSIRRGSHP